MELNLPHHYHNSFYFFIGRLYWTIIRNFKKFEWGNSRYDEYIKNIAFNDNESNIGKVWIFYHKNNHDIAGYVTLAMSQLHKNEHKNLVI